MGGYSNMAFDFTMYIAAMVIFFLGSIDYLKSINPVCAGLLCLTLTLLF